MSLIDRKPSEILNTFYSLVAGNSSNYYGHLRHRNASDLLANTGPSFRRCNARSLMSYQLRCYRFIVFGRGWFHTSLNIWQGLEINQNVMFCAFAWSGLTTSLAGACRLRCLLWSAYVPPTMDRVGGPSTS